MKSEDIILEQFKNDICFQCCEDCSNCPYKESYLEIENILESIDYSISHTYD